MNERIKELVIQADKYANDICDTNANADWYDTRDEKFAQLIIRECVDIVSDTAVDTPPNDLFYGYNLGVNKAAENIKERFEIDELSPFNTVNS
jgi:hypothetical protein